MTLFQQLAQDSGWVQPEYFVGAFALIATFAGALFRDRIASVLAILGALVFIAAGAWALYFWPADPIEVFNGALVIDGFAAFAKALMAFAAAATLLLSADYFSGLKDHRFELTAIMAIAVLGFFVMASANNLIALYIGVELQSLASYVLAAFRRDEARSSEAGLKYFVLGALSSGILLYGCSLVYGFTGSISFDVIAHSVENVGVVFGLVFVICGLAFKMSAAPFHMWTPDVYEGAPTPITAFFTAAPKVAAVALLARVLYGPFAPFEHSWTQVIAALAAISLVWGSLAALVQTNIKRLMAYSSIANVGFVLMGLCGGAAEGPSSALIYLTLYLPMTIGVFAIIQGMRREGAHLEKIEDLAGLGARQPWMGVVLTVLFFSLAGIPPLAGFFGKFYVFKAVIDIQMWWLAIVAALATVVGAGYYLRIVKVVWFDAPAPRFEGASVAVFTTALAATALTFPVLVVLLGSIEQWAALAARTSF
ncbi:MAG TPA: NADH-quinone oxidoreductase subunit NuoN [Caulobacterales bacterium]|jgi:NADH-quinone oxidoreductase subunit N|nr:NADH-quinone oxidoreductase subunit NuoN [Caulobacterales bacterium]